MIKVLKYRRYLLALFVWFLIFVGFLLPAIPAFSQGHLFSEIELKPARVYVGQPAEVSVSVYTSTWFTAGLDPGNIKVEGAFTIYFRSVSISKSINGKTYAGVEMIFNVFPYENENIIFPSLNIKVETPDEGDYKAKTSYVKTPSRLITVRPIPPGFNRQDWLVGMGQWVNETWSGKLTEVKVGEVLNRKIYREVSGTVSELIPGFQWDSLQGVSLYPSGGGSKNIRSKTDISASRTESCSYLFEKEGEVTIPELQFTYWNPVKNRLYKRTLKERTINVLPNPDLEMLESLRDSLLALSADSPSAEEEESEFLIMGMTLKRFIIVSLLIIFHIYITGTLLITFAKWIKRRKKLYLNSELYYYRRFRSALSGKDSSLQTRSMYNWLDRLDLPEPTIAYFTGKYGSDWPRARKAWLTERKNKNRRSGSDWINP